jgi:hypothetical protein
VIVPLVLVRHLVVEGCEDLERWFRSLEGRLVARRCVGDGLSGCQEVCLNQYD